MSLHPFLFLIGYVKLSVSEVDAARFVELCSEFGIPCRSEGFRCSEKGSRAFFICSAISSIRLLKEAALCSIEISDIEKRGVPYFIASHFLSARRIGLSVGLICACLALFFFERVLWDVRIVGNERLETRNILSMLEENGVCIGASKRSIETSVAENNILAASDDIAWISINIRGTVATVEIKESLPSAPQNNYSASNIVSSSGGIVERFEEIHGNLSVSLGDAISEGQLLVGGIYDSNDFCGMRFTRARGKIFARCEKDFHIEIPLAESRKVYTGNKKTKKSLIFFKKEVNFFGNSRNSYASYDKIVTERYFDLFGLGTLPFGIRTVTYLEYEIEHVKKDIEVAMEQALLELSNRIFGSSSEIEILKKQISTEITDTALILDCHIVCIQNVAVEKEIEIDILK